MIFDNQGIKLKFYRGLYKFEDAKGTLGSEGVYPNIIIALFFENLDLLERYNSDIREERQVTKKCNDVVIGFSISEVRTGKKALAVPFSDIIEFGKFLEQEPYATRMCYKYDINALKQALQYDSYLNEFFTFSESGIIYKDKNKQINCMKYISDENKEYIENYYYLKELTEKFHKEKIGAIQKVLK